MQYGSQSGPAPYGGHPGTLQYGPVQTPTQSGFHQPPMPSGPPPKKKTKKRLAAVAAISAAMLASAGVYATTLTVTAKDEAGGAVDVVSCDPDGVNVETGTPAYNATTGMYEVTSVEISGVAAACDGMTLYVTAAKADGTSLATFTHAYDDATDNGGYTKTGLTAFSLYDLDNFVVAIQE